MDKRKKKVVFEETELNYANLRIRLKHDKITQREFFSYLVKKYLDLDHRMLSIIDDLKSSVSRINKRARKKMRSEILEGESLLSDCGLTKEEKNKIYDMIEKEYNEEL